MSKKKSVVPDDVLYKDFNVACPYRAVSKNTKPINAPVRCKDDTKDKKHGWPSHCPNCGWNPEVSKRRLVGMVGEKEAAFLIEQSERLAVITRQEIAEGKYGYV